MVLNNMVPNNMVPNKIGGPGEAPRFLGNGVAVLTSLADRRTINYRHGRAAAFSENEEWSQAGQAGRHIPRPPRRGFIGSRVPLGHRKPSA
jgi:hypothetical protein